MCIYCSETVFILLITINIIHINTHLLGYLKYASILVCFKFSNFDYKLFLYDYWCFVSGFTKPVVDNLIRQSFRLFVFASSLHFHRPSFFIHFYFLWYRKFVFSNVLTVFHDSSKNIFFWVARNKELLFTKKVCVLNDNCANVYEYQIYSRQYLFATFLRLTVFIMYYFGNLQFTFFVVYKQQAGIWKYHELVFCANTVLKLCRL